MQKLPKNVGQKLLAILICIAAFYLFLKFAVLDNLNLLPDASATYDAIKRDNINSTWEMDVLYSKYLHIVKHFIMTIPDLIFINAIISVVIFSLIPSQINPIINALLFTSSFAFVTGVLNQHKSLLFIQLFYLFESSRSNFKYAWPIAIAFNLKSGLIITLSKMLITITTFNVRSYKHWLCAVLVVAASLAAIYYVYNSQHIFLSFYSYEILGQSNIFDFTVITFKFLFLSLLYILCPSIAIGLNSFSIFIVGPTSFLLYFISPAILERFLQLAIIYLSIGYCSRRPKKASSIFLDIIFVSSNIMILSNSSLLT